MSRLSRSTSLAASACAAVLLLAGCGGGSDEPIATGPTEVVAAVDLPGPYAVGCSNVTQDFGRVAAGGDAEDYWEGVRDANGAPRRIEDLLTEPANTLSVTVTAPNDGDLYGNFAGQSLQFVVLACYPTSSDNPRSDFTLPTGDSVPHMQRGAQPPLFADSAARYPVIAFSHGLRGSPLGDDYLKVLTWLASHGYVVAAPFHGDPRFADLTIDDFGEAVSLLANLSDAVAMQALRPLTMSATLRSVASAPAWAARRCC
jgi:Platelet-activating factor acetylhydrolase, isoform II